jgi:hypothetical protein
MTIFIWAYPRGAPWCALPRPPRLRASASPRAALRASRGGGVACFGVLVLVCFAYFAPRRASLRSPSRPYTRLRCVAFKKNSKKIVNSANKSCYLFAFLFFFYICSMQYEVRTTKYEIRTTSIRDTY